MTHPLSDVTNPLSDVTHPLTDITHPLSNVMILILQFWIRIKVYKYLGVYIDTQLNFQYHNKMLTRNINFKVTHFKRIRKFITRSAAELIYKCTILPVLEYADFIVDQGILYINKALQKIQNFCLLIINNQHFLKFNERDSTEDLHRNTKMFRLIHRRRMHLLQFAFTFHTCHEIVDNRNIVTR